MLLLRTGYAVVRRHRRNQYLSACPSIHLAGERHRPAYIIHLDVKVVPA